VIAIGCTGGIGSGKSTVDALLAQRGALVIDTDALARAALAPDGAGYRATIERFGPAVRGDDGELDRGQIAATVFADEAARRDLEAIVHPIVESEVRARLVAADRPGQVVVVDIPLLVETDARARYHLDGVLVVETPLELAVARTVATRRLDEASVRARAAAQSDPLLRLRAADFIILNEGTLAELAAMTGRAWAWLLRLLAERNEQFSAGEPLD